MKVRRANGDRYHQPWLHYALKARTAGYPGRDGWRDKVTKDRRKAAREMGGMSPPWTQPSGEG